MARPLETSMVNSGGVKRTMSSCRIASRAYSCVCVCACVRADVMENQFPKLLLQRAPGMKMMQLPQVEYSVG